MLELEIRSEQAMIELGEVLGERVKPGDLLFLSGNLGAGKTTMVKGIAKGMGIESNITSPTFQLVKTYHGKYILNHLDLYRLGTESDVEILELEDLAAEGVMVIEWGDLIKDRLFVEYLEIQIGFDEAVDSRKVTFIPSGSRYELLVEELHHVDFRY